jgi:hypothetical protein
MLCSPFQRFSPDLVQAIETIDDRKTHHQKVQRHPDVVRQMEKKYMFCGNQADIARNEIRGTDPACSMFIFGTPSLTP